MEEFYLDDYIIDSIENGLIHENILDSLKDKELYSNNECVFRLKNSLLKYIKAYMVYGICGYVQNTDSSLDAHDSLENSMSPTYIRNYTMLRNSEKAVSTEIAILFDILKNAALSDEDIRLLFIMNKISYINIKEFEKDPNFDNLKKYDKLFDRVVEDIGEDIFNLPKKDLIHLAKCYVLSKQDLSDSEYICGSSSFLYNVINDAYSIYEGYLKSYYEMIEERDNDREKVRTLKEIIKQNNFKNR